MLGSWVVSRVYAEESFSANLRVFALKASEKVNNLSNELDRLSGYLQRELDESDYNSPSEELLAKELKMEGAIHMLGTLKSVNDGSLSDWQGVIDKELSEQREQQVEREEELKELVERVEALYTAQADDDDSGQRQLEAAMRAEINKIRGDLRVLTSQVGGTPVRRAKSQRQKVDLICPSCSESVTFHQKLKPNSVKAVTCTHCDAALISQLSGEGFVLRLRQPVIEPVVCPVCSTAVKVSVDPLPGTATKAVCSACSAPLRVVRSQRGMSVRPIVAALAGGTTITLTDEILQLVREAMPSQPWPTGAAKEVAARLGLPLRLVSHAVQELIRRGDFALQIEGRLYHEAAQHLPLPSER
jgi:hypothetical protein